MRRNDLTAGWGGQGQTRAAASAIDDELINRGRSNVTVGWV